MSTVTGEPEVACALTPGDARDRVAEWRELVARNTGRDEIVGGVRLMFRSEPGTAAAVADLAEREQACCPFFEFTVGISRAHVSLEVRAPAGAEGVVDALVGSGEVEDPIFH